MTSARSGRRKRAWFLNRLNSLDGVAPLEVLAGRWDNSAGGEPGAANELDDPTHILISLKALHLTDPEVLGGLIPFLPQSQDTPAASGDLKVLIARFYPPGQTWSDDLAQDLKIPPSGEVQAFPDWEFRGTGGSVLLSKAPQGASLVLSRYIATSPQDRP